MIDEAQAPTVRRIFDEAVAEQTDLREVFLTLFPNGLTFTADRSPDGARQVWRITGEASFGSLVDSSGPDCVATPTVPHANETSGCASPCSSWPCGRPQHSGTTHSHRRRQNRSSGRDRIEIAHDFGPTISAAAPLPRSRRDPGGGRAASGG